MTAEQAPPPPVMSRMGATVYDCSSGRSGIVTDIQGRGGPRPVYVPRPVNGPFSDVWVVSPRQLRKAP